MFVISLVETSLRVSLHLSVVYIFVWVSFGFYNQKFKLNYIYQICTKISYLL